MARRALVSVAVALAGCAVVTAAGWGVEMVGLPQATATDRLVAKAEGWLRDDPLTSVSFHGRGVHARGLCLRTSVGSFARSRLALKGGPVFAVSTGHVRRVRGKKVAGFPALLASRIGCSATLLQPVMAAAEARVHVGSYAPMNMGPLIALNFPPYKKQRLVLYVNPKTGRPFLAAESLRGLTVTAFLRLRQVDEAALARLRAKLSSHRKGRR